MKTDCITPPRALPIPRDPHVCCELFASAPRRPRPLACAVLLALAASANPALAQETPLGFGFGPGETITYDNNVLRLPSNTQTAGSRSDVSSFTSLTGTLHENYGREDISLAATVGRVLYKRLTQLDYTQQDLHGTLRLDLPLTIGATITASHNATLAHFAELATTARNVITRDDANADLDLPVLADWRTVAGAQGSRSRNSNDLFKSQDFNTGEVHGGIRYQPTTGNHVDLTVRTVSGTYVNGSPSSYVGPGYTNRGIDLSADWTFSGASHLHGRAGYVKHTNDDHRFPLLNSFGFPVFPPTTIDINRNFAGPAFDLTYVWQITALTSVKFFGLRESGAAGDNNYQSAVTHSYRITPSFRPTAKIEVDTYADWTKRDYFTNVLAGTALFNNTKLIDHSHSFGVTAVWNPRRWVQASLDLRREARNSTVGNGDFEDSVATLQIQGTF